MKTKLVAHITSPVFFIPDRYDGEVKEYLLKRLQAHSVDENGKTLCGAEDREGSYKYTFMEGVEPNCTLCVDC